MLKTDIDPARIAAKYLDDTAAYDSTQVTAFVITAKQPAVAGGPGGSTPSVTVVIDPVATPTAFNNLLTAFSNRVTANRTAAQTVLTNLGITG